MKLVDVKINLHTLHGLMDKKLPVRLSFNIAYNIEVLARESERIDKERIRLCEMYCDKDENGNPIILDGNAYSLNDDAVKRVQNEYAELLNSDIDVPIRKVRADVFENWDDLGGYHQLSIEEIRNLFFMLEG